MSDPITIQSLTSADREAVLALDQAAFGFDGRDLDPEADTEWIEWDRAFGARRAQPGSSTQSPRRACVRC